MDEHKILRPAPRKPAGFSLTPVDSTTDMTKLASENSSSSQPPPSLSVDTQRRPAGSFTKTRSILNLTSSTLFGIYDPTGYDTNREDNLNTPWGTGAQTPIRRVGTDERQAQVTVEAVQAKTGALQENGKIVGKKHARSRSLSVSGAKQRVSTTKHVFRLLLRSAALCLMGLAYGSIVTQLQGTKGIAPVEMKNIDRGTWTYLGFWAAAGLILGNLLPWVDRVWTSKQTGGMQALSANDEDRSQEQTLPTTAAQARNSLGADWNPVVRSIGAFVGIAFAIRRLPWQSTLQVSLTLALANPVIWYLLDRSRNGFLLSAAFSLTGASALLSINPSMLPTPTTTHPSNTPGFPPQHQNATTHAAVGQTMGMTATTQGYETIAVATWIASVLFCSCVCFGNIGRRLAPEGGRPWSL